jgi:dGTPase
VRKGRPPRQRSATAEIMDWADDITFAIHDLLDFYCAGRVPIDRCKGRKSAERDRLIRSMFTRKPKWEQEHAKYVDALSSIVEEFPFEPEDRFTDSANDRARLHDFSTGLIRYFVESFRLAPTAAGGVVAVDPDARREVEVLKQFIWEYVIENPELAVLQSGQRAAIRTVFTRLMLAADDKEYHLFPASYRIDIEKATNKASRVRLAADCISGMTERELLHYYRRLQGMIG